MDYTKKKPKNQKFKSDKLNQKSILFENLNNRIQKIFRKYN